MKKKTKAKPKKKAPAGIAVIAKSKDFMRASTSVKDVVGFAEKIVVSNEKERLITTGHLERIARSIRDLDSIRKRFTKPIKDSAKNIEVFFKEHTEPMRAAEAIFRKKIESYLDECDKTNAEETQRLADDHEEESDDARDLGATPPDAPAALPSLEKKVSDTSGRKVLKIEITDLSRVPVEFLLLNESRVKEAYKAGRVEIPGLELTERNALTVR